MIPVGGCNTETDGKTYSVSLPATVSGGVIECDKLTVKSGENVTFTVKCDEGMMVAFVKVNGQPVTLYNGEYTVYSVAENLKIEVELVSSEATVSFVSGTDEKIDPITVKRNEPIGTLPTPTARENYVFSGWYTKEDGGELIKQSSLMENESLTLYARWRELTQTDVENVSPYSITCSIYDGTDLGVSWHTKEDGVQPVIQITDGEAEDFSSAREIACTSTLWYKEYTVQGVIDGLIDGKSYRVRLGDKYYGVFSDTFTFNYTDGADKESISFLHVTDTQQTYKNANVTWNGSQGIDESFFSRVMKDAVARFPEAEFLTHGGDITNYAAEVSYWAEMLGEYEGYTFEYPYMAVGGNHEEPTTYGADKTQILQNHFNVDAPMQDGSNGMYYSVDYGPVHFIVLNTNDVFTNNHYLSNEQLNWFKADVRAAQAKANTVWTVVMMHEGPVVPTHSANVWNDNYTGLRPQMLKAFDEADVDLVMYGHNHYLISSFPIVYDENASTYIIDREEKYISVATKNYTAKTLAGYDGITFDTFDNYRSGTDGTVYHQIGCAGYQYNQHFKVSALQENLEKYQFYRNMRSGDYGCTFENDSRAYSMYAYIEADGEKLLYRTYAVSYTDQPSYAYPATASERLLDSFALYK